MAHVWGKITKSYLRVKYCVGKKREGKYGVVVKWLVRVLGVSNDIVQRGWLTNKGRVPPSYIIVIKTTIRINKCKGNREPLLSVRQSTL